MSAEGLLRRFLDADGGHDAMPGMPGSDGELPAGVYHSIHCEGYRELSYENVWMIPFLALLCVLVPWGWVNRIDGVREGNTQKKRKGYRILGVCFLLGLVFLIFENGVNHSPLDQIPYSNKIVYACFITVVPLYIFLRDSGVLCPTGARCCCGRKGGYGEMFCMAQGEFWDYGMMAISSVGVPMCGLWSSMACHDVQIELGHWVPFLGYMAYAGVLLYFAGPSRRNTIQLQYAEGWVWVAWGIVFNLYFMPGSGGGLFYRFFHGGQTSRNWAPDQQHIFQAMLYIFAGAAGIVLGLMNIKTGFHMAVLGASMYSMLSVHPQYCLLAKDMHVIAGQLFLVVGLLRFAGRIVETSMVMTILSGAFVFSSSCTVTWGDANFERISFVAVIIMLWGSWWLYVAWMFQEHWNIQESVTPPMNGGEKHYEVVKPAAVDEDDEPLESGN
jgi:hypothetical protein